MRLLSGAGPRGGRTICEHTRIHKRGVDEQVGCQVTLCLASDSFHLSASPLLQSTFPLHAHWILSMYSMSPNNRCKLLVTTRVTCMSFWLRSLLSINSLTPKYRLWYTSTPLPFWRGRNLCENGSMDFHTFPLLRATRTELQIGPSQLTFRFVL
jgi:hypothetical protein